ELDPATKRQLFREAKVLAEEQVKDAALTEEVLRQLLDEDEANVWALEELTRLRQAAADYAEVLKLLLRRAELSTDGLELSRLQSATSSEDAIETLRSVLLDDPTEAAAVVHLSQLYEKEGLDEELAGLLSSQIDLAKERRDAATELTLTVRLGDIYESR